MVWLFRKGVRNIPARTALAEQASDGRPSRWRPRLRRIALVGLVLVLTVLVGGAATAYLVGSHLVNKVNRINGAFDGIDPAKRPPSDPATASSETFLAVGSDLRAPEQTTGLDAADQKSTPGDQRTDAIMLIRLDRRNGTASVVSIPRDSWVAIPDHGTMKINAAYPLGGPPLLIQTVEQLTKVRVDHFMIIDFVGFQSIVDALGGVDVEVAASTVDSSGLALHKGTNHLNGSAALAYVRERHSLPKGDFDRIRRQQNFLRAVITGIAKTDPANNPGQLYRLLDAMTRTVTVDDGMKPNDLRQLALDGARLDDQNLWFLTARVAGVGWEGDQSVVYLDDKRNAELWEALRTDTMVAYVADHRADLLSPHPN